MHVRRATYADRDSIVEFIAEEAREAEGLALETETLQLGIGSGLKDNSIAEYWLLTDASGIACGCTSVVKEWSDWNAGYYWWIQSMYIAPDHRGKGYIDMLLDSIADAARASNCVELRLYVHEKNKAALRAYEKAGFGRAPYFIMSRAI